MTGVFVRRQPCKFRHTQGGSHVLAEAEMGIMQLQAKKCQRFPASHQKLGRSKGRFYYEFQREQGPAV